MIFGEAERFDIRRANASRHLGFGSRTHACLGSGLARLEARIGLECLLDRLPELSLADNQTDLAYRPNLVMPAVKALHVRW
jgi:cytochrome P450